MTRDKVFTFKLYLGHEFKSLEEDTRTDTRLAKLKVRAENVPPLNTKPIGQSSSSVQPLRLACPNLGVPGTRTLILVKIFTQEGVPDIKAMLVALEGYRGINTKKC